MGLARILRPLTVHKWVLATAGTKTNHLDIAITHQKSKKPLNFSALKNKN